MASGAEDCGEHGLPVVAYAKSYKSGLAHSVINLTKARWNRLKAAVVGMKGINRARNLAKEDMDAFKSDADQAMSEALKQGGVTLFVASDKDLSCINYMKQGDADMYTEDMINQRHALRHDTAVIEVMRDWWRFLPKNDHVELDITKAVYSAMVVLVQMVLLPRFDMKGDIHYDPEEDWQHDSKGQPRMDFPNFFDAMFELADMWCEDVCAKDYACLLTNLLEDAKAKAGMFDKLLKRFGYAPLPPAAQPPEEQLCAMRLPPAPCPAPPLKLLAPQPAAPVKPPPAPPARTTPAPETNKTPVPETKKAPPSEAKKIPPPESKGPQSPETKKNAPPETKRPASPTGRNTPPPTPVRERPASPEVQQAPPPQTERVPPPARQPPPAPDTSTPRSPLEPPPSPARIPEPAKKYAIEVPRADARQPPPVEQRPGPRAPSPDPGPALERLYAIQPMQPQIRVTRVCPRLGHPNARRKEEVKLDKPSRFRSVTCPSTPDPAHSAYDWYLHYMHGVIDRARSSRSVPRALQQKEQELQWRYGRRAMQQKRQLECNLGLAVGLGHGLQSLSLTITSQRGMADRPATSPGCQERIRSMSSQPHDLQRPATAGHGSRPPFSSPGTSRLDARGFAESRHETASPMSSSAAGQSAIWLAGGKAEGKGRPQSAAAASARQSRCGIEAAARVRMGRFVEAKTVLLMPTRQMGVAGRPFSAQSAGRVGQIPLHVPLGEYLVRKDASTTPDAQLAWAEASPLAIDSC